MANLSENRKTISEKTTLLQNIPLFHGLSREELDAIAHDLVERNFQQGETVFHEGDLGNGFYIIYTGRVRIFVLNLDGQETSLIIYGHPGDLFGELSTIDGLPRSATALAIDQTTLFYLNGATFHKHLQKSTHLSMNLMHGLTKLVRKNTQQVHNLVSLPIPNRLAAKLLDLGRRYGRPVTNGILIETRLTQTDLASLISATRESTNKALNQLRRQGTVGTENGRFVLINLKHLQNLTEGHNVHK